MRNLVRKSLAGLLLCLLPMMALGGTGRILMVRSPQMFPETMITLQNTIRKFGYRISRVQRVDIGLTKSGYKTDRYRVVFFGKADEVRTIVNRYPQLAAYLPMKISLFAEGRETIVLAADPMMLTQVVDARELRPILQRWSRDLQKILEVVRKSED